MEKIKASEFATQNPQSWNQFIEACKEAYKIQCEDCPEDIEVVDFTLPPDEFIEQQESLDYPFKYTFYKCRFNNEDHVAVWCYSDNGRFNEWLLGFNLENNTYYYDFQDYDVVNLEFLDFLEDQEI